MQINAVTVCVDYAHYLKLTVSNRETFNRWIIVTIEDDKDTINLCKEHDLEYIYSERLYEGGDFCKGKALNEALIKLPLDWVAQVDADTYIFPSALKQITEGHVFQEDVLYGLYGRFMVDDEEQLKEYLSRDKLYLDEVEDVQILTGFFQMWHRSVRPFYPEESTHAGLDDILMRDSFKRDKWEFLPTCGIHIGPQWINHKGVVNV